MSEETPDQQPETWKNRFYKFRAMVELLRGHYELDWSSYTEREANLMRTGVIDDFKITIELAWKTLKDYLRDEKAVLAKAPRDVVKEAWSHDLVGDIDGWLEMLVLRNELTHRYDRHAAMESFGAIRDQCLPLLREMVAVLDRRQSDE